MRWIVVTCLATACAAPPAQESAQPEPGPDGTLLSYEGRVVVAGTGGTPLTTVSVDGRGAVGVVGALEPEIRALAGARVRVEGPAGSGFPGESVDVRNYSVLEVNGERPWVGVLRNGASLALQLTADELMLISGGPAGLADLVGAKVWLTGTVTSGRLQVQSFGVIRPR